MTADRKPREAMRAHARYAAQKPSDDLSLEELEARWRERGPAAIATVRRMDPVRYVRAIARLLRGEDTPEIHRGRKADH